MKNRKKIRVTTRKTNKLVMPVGRYKDKEMVDIPSSYLKWIAENFRNGRICYAADEEFQLREKFNNHWEET